MKILITGAGGFVGSQLARLFGAAGWQVVAAYHRTRPMLDGASGSIRLVRVDLDQECMKNEPVDVVVHAAAHTHLIPNSSCDDYIRGNLATAVNLCHSLDALKPGLVVYLSTLSVYGTVTDSVVDEKTPFYNPECYGTTKYLGEMIFHENCEVSALACLRLPGVVGPGYLRPWLGRTLARIIAHEPVTAYNPDAPFNNVVDTHELFRLISHLHRIAWKGHKTVTVAAANPMPIRDVVELFCHESQSRSAIEYAKTNQTSFVIDTRSLETDMQFKPSETCEILQNYCRNNLNNESHNSRGAL